MNSTKKQARVAGILYLLASIIGFFGLIYVPSTVIISGDATATADHVRASPNLLRFGIASELTSFIIFIFVVLALYRLFKAVNGKHALAMAILLLFSHPYLASLRSTVRHHWKVSIKRAKAVKFGGKMGGKSRRNSAGDPGE